MKSQISRFFVWIIMALVLVGMIGFGSFNFGGGPSVLGRVGDTEITADDYYLQLTTQLNRFQETTGARLTIAEAEAFGLTQNVLDQVITDAALSDETAKLGLSVGDARLSDQIREITGFTDATGQFDVETYKLALDQSGLSAAQFEEGLRDDVARTILATAVSEGMVIQPVYTNTLYAWARETRSFTWAKLGELELEGEVPAPSEAELTAYYEAHPADFTAPDMKTITYAWLTPEAMLPTLTIEEADLRAAYDARLEEFQTPEQRMAERLVFGSTEEAEAAKARLDEGELTFDALVTERGLTLADVDLGDPVAQSDLTAAAGDAVFGAEVGDIVGPVDSQFGPALFRLNAVIDASEVSFEEAREELKGEFAADTARRAVADLATALDETLAGGATLEELKADYPMITVETFDWAEGDSDGLAAYDDFREAARAAEVGDYPAIEMLEDESLFALRVDALVPSRLMALDEVREAATEGWRAEKLVELLTAQAEAQIPALEAGDTLATLGLTEVRESEQPRGAFIAGAPEGFIDAVFKAEANVWTVTPAPDGAVLWKVDEIHAADPSSEDAAVVKAQFEERMNAAMGADLLDAFAKSIETEAGVEINNAMINAIHADMP